MLRKKLWEMTGFEKVNPKLSLEKALNKCEISQGEIIFFQISHRHRFGGLVTQVAIERSHRMGTSDRICVFKPLTSCTGIFSNEKGVLLEADDEKRMAAVAAHVCRTRYQGLSDADQKVMARLGAGTLPADVVRRYVTAL